MVKLFGKTLTRRDVEARTGSLSQFAGVRLTTLGDGLERGNRTLEFRTGSGLIFTVLVDRALDIASCEFKGLAIGWHSPAGFRAPGLNDADAENGLGWLRSFSGLVSTCGLDHIFGPVSEGASHFNYPYRKTVTYPIHGRVSSVPARLTGYGEQWTGDDCVLWCEGVVQQATVFGENLHLIRRIEADVGGNDIRITDRVVNRGFSRTPHMMLYHIDVGYPLLGAGARYVAPISEVLWASHAGDNYTKQSVGYRTLSDPKPNFIEQVWQFDMTPDAEDRVHVALMNDALGLGFEITTRKSELPCQLEWQNLQEGMYCLGLEPATHHVLGKTVAHERGEMIWLEHDEERHYHLTLSVLDGPAQIAASAARIAIIKRQPDEDFPAPTGKFPRLAGGPT